MAQGSGRGDRRCPMCQFSMGRRVDIISIEAGIHRPIRAASWRRDTARIGISALNGDTS